MVYESTINFTLDTICPWTYIAKKRLDMALDQVRANNPAVTFKLHYTPYLLHPLLPTTPTSKSNWYIHEKYASSPSQYAKYTTLMTAHGATVSIPFSFTDRGTISNTLPAHCLLQALQDKYGVAAADRALRALYRLYFEEEADPSAMETLGVAWGEAGVEGEGVEGLIGVGGSGERREWEGVVKERVAEQKGDGIDAVPYVVVEGRKRDFTLEGCREVSEYVKILEQVVRESS